MKHYLAIDIGASSGRHILGHRDAEGHLRLEEVYRFDNSQVERGGHACWDVGALFANVVAGLKACAARGVVPESVAIDTWGVDFVLLDSDGRECSDAVAYRDRRTEGVDAIAEAAISPQELYSRAGIQKMSFNTLYQLLALKRDDPAALERAAVLLLMPEYLNYRLTGKIVHDYTNATTTNLVNAAAKDWDVGVIDRLGLPRRIFGPLSMPGAEVGALLPEVAREAGFQTRVVLAASHDTASAYLAVPARDDRSVYISSGTWSLLGVENAEPITSEASRQAGFTNEGGYAYRFRYLKNIMGLWMLQSIRRELNGTDYVAGRDRGASEAALATLADFDRTRTYSFADIEALARAARCDAIVDVNAQRFMAPESMTAEVLAACAEAGVAPPATVGELALCVYRSLAACYAKAIAGLESMTGKRYTAVNIVGGGCRDCFLNELTAAATGLEVIAGPVEGTAVGNLIVQALAAGEFHDLAEARAAIVRE
ncbi:MAG: rhamnulokinase [Kiritimatiellae bacterium]|nr:rhamnulokinase [Kiritimatiellia bacterium]